MLHTTLPPHSPVRRWIITQVGQPPTAQTALTRRLAAPMREFIATQNSSAVVLLAATTVALVWANSPWSESYERALAHGARRPVRDGRAGPRPAALDQRRADGLLLLRRRARDPPRVRHGRAAGARGGWRRRCWPPSAGMAVPALIYLAVNAGEPDRPGLGHRHGHRHRLRPRDPHARRRARLAAEPGLPAHAGDRRRHRRAHRHRAGLHRGRLAPGAGRRRLPVRRRPGPAPGRGAPRRALLPRRARGVAGHARLGRPRRPSPASPSACSPPPTRRRASELQQAGALWRLFREQPTPEYARTASRSLATADLTQRAAPAPLPPVDQLRDRAALRPGQRRRRAQRRRPPRRRLVAGHHRHHPRPRGRQAARHHRHDLARHPAPARRLPADRALAAARRGGHRRRHRLHRVAAHRRHLLRRRRTGGRQAGILGASILASALAWVVFRLVDRLPRRLADAGTRPAWPTRSSTSPSPSIPRSTTSGARPTPGSRWSSTATSNAPTAGRPSRSSATSSGDVRRRPGLRLPPPPPRRRPRARRAGRRGRRGGRRRRAGSGRCTTCSSPTRTRLPSTTSCGTPPSSASTSTGSRPSADRRSPRAAGRPRRRPAPTRAAWPARRRSSSTAAATTAPTTSSHSPPPSAWPRPPLRQ